MGKLEELDSFNRENYILFKTYHTDELRVDDLELAPFVCVTTIEALTHNAVLHSSKMLSDQMMQALIEDAARLITAYLKR